MAGMRPGWKGPQGARATDLAREQRKRWTIDSFGGRQRRGANDDLSKSCGKLTACLPMIGSCLEVRPSPSSVVARG
jgi:hypothetical protein